jgi:hypothetical protein
MIAILILKILKIKINETIMEREEEIRMMKRKVACNRQDFKIFKKIFCFYDFSFNGGKSVLEFTKYQLLIKN